MSTARFNLAYKSKTNSGSKNFTTFWNTGNVYDDAAFAGLRVALNTRFLANNAKCQVSHVLNEVSDQDIELPPSADLVDEKDVKFYLGNADDAQVFAVITFGHIKRSEDFAEYFKEVIEGNAGGMSTSPFMTADGVRLNKVIRYYETIHEVVQGEH